MNKNRLISAMKLHGDTSACLAEYLGMARSTLSSKMNEKGSEFNQRDILKIKIRYSLSPEEVDKIFFD